MTPVYDDDLERATRQRGLGKPRPKGKLPYLPDGRDLEQLQEWLTRAFRPPEGYRVDTFDRHGRQDADPATLMLRNGRDTLTYRFTTQAALQGRRLRRTVLSVADGELDMPHLTDSEIDDLWAALCKFGKVRAEVDERDETLKWIEQLLDVAAPLRGKTLVPDGRHDALMALRHLGEFTRPDALALKDRREEALRRPVRFIDAQTNEQWVRAGETAAFVRYVVGVDRIAQSTLQGRLQQIGVEAQRFEDYRPPHPKNVLFRLTDALVEYVDAHLPETDNGSAQEAMRSDPKTALPPSRPFPPFKATRDSYIAVPR